MEGDTLEVLSLVHGIADARKPGYCAFGIIPDERLFHAASRVLP